VTDAAGRYIEFCKSTIPASLDFRAMKVVVDCAHGATYHVAPSVIEELGAEVIPIGVHPDGFNINEDCGSTFPKATQMAVLEHGADLGIALDGDGDRVIMVDHKGEVVDGDELLFIIAQSRAQAGTLNGAVVGTLMSNFGLEQALRSQGIDFKRAAVGDRHVMEMLRGGGWTLGGESSGHIICLDRTTTGDGIVAALQVLVEVLKSGRSLHELKKGMIKYPQCMVNVPVVAGFDVAKSSAIQEAYKDVLSTLHDEGRVLLRPSGTEPVIRVMVEGADSGQVQSLANQLAEVVARAAING
jgi:phosphoglucosamine mutase